jgi:uncharacterized lipoprotein YmbA
MRSRRRVAEGMVGLILAASLTLAACGRSPDVRRFMLGTQFPPEVGSALGSEEGSEPASTSVNRAPDLAVLIGPIRLPDYLDRPQIARRVGGGEIELDEFNRWLGGFEKNLTTALASDVRRRLGSVRVVGYPSSAPFPIDYSVRIHVDEWIVDESNRLQVALRWALSESGKGSSPILSDYTTSLELSGRSTEAIVAAHDRAIADLALHLADALVAAAR